MRLSLVYIKHHIGETQEFQLCEDLPTPEEFGYKYFTLIEPVYLTCVVTNKGNSHYLLEGYYKTQVNLFCSRCLETYNISANGNIQALYTIDGKQDENGEIDIRSFHGNEIDINEFLIGEIALNLPVQPLCNEQCKGLCPICGINLNKEHCNCTKENLDSRWGKLRDFKTKRNE